MQFGDKRVHSFPRIFKGSVIPKRLRNSDSNDLYKSFLGQTFFSNCSILASSSHNAYIEFRSFFLDHVFPKLTVFSICFKQLVNCSFLSTGELFYFTSRF